MTTKKTKSKTGPRSKKSDSDKAPTLSAAPSPQDAGSDGRGGTRVPIQLLVDYKADGHYLFDFCKDLGTGGVFIQTSRLLKTGADIDLTFTIPDSKETLTAKGTVIWVQSPVADRKDLTPGMGVQFNGFSGEQRKTLENFVQRYHGQRYKAPGEDKATKAG